jgi:hypothetical protein
MVKAVGEERNLDDVSKYVVTGKAGDVIFQQGDQTTDMYIIQEGEVEILRGYAGEVRQMARLEAGDFFGEMSLLQETPREASAHALTDYELLRIDLSTFDQIVEENPEIPVRMLQKLSRRLREREEADLRAAQIAFGPLAPAGAGPAPAPGAPPAPPPVADSAAGTMRSMKTAGTAKKAAAAPTRGFLVHTQSKTRFPLPDGTEATVGRIDRSTGLSPDVDLTRFDTGRSLSRRHAKILKREGGFTVREEIGAHNGTFLNGKRLETGIEMKLKDGDTIRFGLVETVFHCQ